MVWICPSSGKPLIRLVPVVGLAMLWLNANDFALRCRHRPMPGMATREKVVRATERLQFAMNRLLDCVNFGQAI